MCAVRDYKLQAQALQWLSQRGMDLLSARQLFWPSLVRRCCSHVPSKYAQKRGPGITIKAQGTRRLLKMASNTPDQQHPHLTSWPQQAWFHGSPRAGLKSCVWCDFKHSKLPTPPPATPAAVTAPALRWWRMWTAACGTS